MKSSELRLGNLIRATQSEHWNEMYRGKIEEVNIDNIKDIYFANKDRRLYEPIPLTAKWVEKLGGKKISSNEIFELEYEFSPMFMLRENKATGRFYHKDSMILRYVHQLQNLCYALTGRELVLAVTPNEV